MGASSGPAAFEVADHVPARWAARQRARAAQSPAGRARAACLARRPDCRRLLPRHGSVPYLSARGAMDEADTSWAGRDERVFSYLPAERTVLGALPPEARILDLGCSDGPHIPRLSAGGRVVGVDVPLARLAEAKRLAPVAAGRGERLPFRAGSFDMVYVSHVLHHAGDHRAVLR